MGLHGKRGLRVVEAMRQIHFILSSQMQRAQVQHQQTLTFRSVASRSPSVSAAESDEPKSKLPHHKYKPRQEKKKLKIAPQVPEGGEHDWIGPPDPTSNIRPIKFYIPPDETETERQFRLKREETLQWNHEFWAKHNTKFFQEKEAHSKSVKAEENSKKLTPEQMSVFYRKFLNENRQAHLEYNREWYKRNISLLWPALKVTLIGMRRKLQGKK